MFKKVSCCFLFAVSAVAQAGLVSMDNDSMTEVTGQGGADLNWTLSLNHKYANDMTLTNISKMDGAGNVTEAYYQKQCVTDVLCRVAISPNNHTEGGVQKWLVFKQFQGTLQVDKFSLDGSTITNKDGKLQTAMNLSFYDDKPLKIRNLGFSSLAVEAGSTGYLSNIVYGNDGYATNAGTFDKGQEKGFMGMNIHGNLHMSGNLKVFSYNCSGDAGNRC